MTKIPAIQTIEEQRIATGLSLIGQGLERMRGFRQSGYVPTGYCGSIVVVDTGSLSNEAEPSLKAALKHTALEGNVIGVNNTAPNYIGTGGYQYQVRLKNVNDVKTLRDNASSASVITWER